MDVRIHPGQGRGSVTAPPSKSMAHRLLLCAGLAPRRSVVEHVAFSEDILATLDCLRSLGAEICIQGSTVELTGADPRSAAPEGVVSCRESGSTLRFFIPLFLLSGAAVTLSGEGRLPQRPQSVYQDLCRQQGLTFRQEGQEIFLQGPLQGGELTIPGDVSSQFASGLLFALPLLEGGSRLQLTPPVESRSYINMTLQALADFGVSARWQGENTLLIPGGQHYHAARRRVEGDWSNAAFFLALQALGDSVTVEGLVPESLQGDKICLPYFDALAKGSPTLDISDCPDLGPILMALGAALHGLTLTGTRRLQLKESDRGAVMAQELEKCGVHCKIEENSIQVSPGLCAPTQPLEGHNDHRIVMALSVLLTRCGGVITGAQAVQKSFPDFFSQLQQLGIEVQEWN